MESRMERKPPRPTQIAVALLGASFAAGLARIVIDGNLLRSSTSWLWIAGYAALISLLLYFLWRGKNWLRWLSTIFIVVGMAVLPWSLAEIGPFWQKVIYAGQGVLQTVAVILMFFPSSRAWFRPNNSFKPSPLRGLGPTDPESGGPA